MNQSMIRLANGRQFVMHHNKTTGILRGRQRPIIELTVVGTPDEFAEIREAFGEAANTQTMTLIYHGDDASLTPEQLAGVAQEELLGYSIPGEFVEKEIVTREETPKTPAEYGWQLTIQLGRRLFGE